MKLAASFLFASALLAQESSTVTFSGLAFVGAGGGSSSAEGTTGFTSVPSVGGEGGASLTYTAEPGFIESNDPVLPAAPIAYGLLPAFGSRTGGTSIVISGVNFDLFMSGPSLTVDVGGVPASNVVVASDTRVTCTMPPGPKGPVRVAVTTSEGTSLVPGVFVYSPGITIASAATPGTPLTVTNYGPPGMRFFTYYRFGTQSSSPGPAGFGTALMGRNPVQAVLQKGTTYPTPDGVHRRRFTVPNVSTLSGGMLSVKTLAVTSTSPLQSVWTNEAFTVIN